MTPEYTGKKIYILRTEKGMTQKDLADAVGVTDRAVSKWENGKNFPDIALLEPLAEALDCNVMDLLGPEKNFDKDLASLKDELEKETDVPVRKSSYVIGMILLLLPLIPAVLPWRVFIQYLHVVHIFALIGFMLIGVCGGLLFKRKRYPYIITAVMGAANALLFLVIGVVYSSSQQISNMIGQLYGGLFTNSIMGFFIKLVQVKHLEFLMDHMYFIMMISSIVGVIIMVTLLHIGLSLPRAFMVRKKRTE